MGSTGSRKIKNIGLKHCSHVKAFSEYLNDINNIDQNIDK